MNDGEGANEEGKTADKPIPAILARNAGTETVENARTEGNPDKIVSSRFVTCCVVQHLNRRATAWSSLLRRGRERRPV
jgi:hypothetical protein